MEHTTRRSVARHALLASGLVACVVAGLSAAPWLPAQATATQPPAATTTPAPDLMQPIATGLTLEEAALQSAVEEWARRAGAKVFVNWAALEMEGVARGQKVSVNTPAGVTAWAELNLILHAADGEGGLDHRVEGGVVTISTRNDLIREIRTQVYDVRRLLADPYPKAAEMTVEQSEQFEALARPVMDLLRLEVQPGHWKDNGGHVAAVSNLNGQLVVTATDDMHADIERLLGRLQP